MENATQQVANDLKVIVSKIIEVDVSKIGMEQSFQSLGADSMMLLEIIVAVEKKFGVDLPEEEIPKLTNLVELVNVVQQFTTQKK